MMTSELLREFAAYLFAYARFADPETDLAAVYGRVIRQQAAFSEQLQAARALLLEKPRATPERVRLAASIGLILDALDALVAAQCDLPDLRRLPAAAEWMRRIGILVRATALDVQHLSLDLLAHREPALPRDHQLARDSARREGLRLIADEDTPADVREAIGRTLARFDAARAAIHRLERALGDDEAAAEADRRRSGSPPSGTAALVPSPAIEAASDAGLAGVPLRGAAGAGDDGGRDRGRASSAASGTATGCC